MRFLSNIFLHPTIKQLIRFGVVGCGAALVNILIVIWLVERFNINPLTANIFAFLSAFNVSYIGHRYWSFPETKTNLEHLASIFRFLFVATISFALNEGLFYIFLSIFHWHYVAALLLVLITVPLFTFVCSKFWAFS